MQLNAKKIFAFSCSRYASEVSLLVKEQFFHPPQTAPKKNSRENPGMHDVLVRHVLSAVNSKQNV